MSVYFVKDKGWRYDFKKNKTRYSSKLFETREQAILAEADKRKELIKETIKENTGDQSIPDSTNSHIQAPSQIIQYQKPILPDMDFKTMASIRLDYLEDYNGLGQDGEHYNDNRLAIKKWLKTDWGKKKCVEITTEDVYKYLKNRKDNVSPNAANKHLILIRALFNLGIKKKLLIFNPAAEIEPFPENTKKKKKYVPPQEDLDKVINAALEESEEDHDYLWVHRETFGRTSEINRMEWDDVDLDARIVTLYTRKKRGGSLTPRDIEMTAELYRILIKRYQTRNREISWVFWHHYWSRKQEEFIIGPFGYRNRMMEKFCKKAGVKHFGFHGFRRAGASIMANDNAPISAIQEILGHESRETTEIYIRSLKGVRHKAMRLYERGRQK
jgi:integrase